jgi:P-type Cu+ transporter
MPIRGMTCSKCIGHVDKALRSVPGVTDASVNLATETARVRGSGLDRSKLEAAVKKAGYEVGTATPDQKPAAAGWMFWRR